MSLIIEIIGEITPLPKVTCSLIFSVKVHRVCAIEVLDSFGDILLFGL
jgi:hypothetical protein